MELTPKEKAKELVEKYRGVAHSDFHNQTGYDEAQREENQKQCALIAVDEIINSRPAITDSQIQYINYWNEVKQEINNL
jgi:hypothetical protein